MADESAAAAPEMLEVMETPLERIERRAPIIAAVVTLFVGLATMTPTILGVFFDDAVYLLVGKAIASGQGFVYPQLPGTPAAIHYPPLFPMLLAVVWKISPSFPANVVLFKLVNPILVACAAYGAVRVGERLFALRPLWALAVVLAATASVPVHVLTTVVLSEPLFLALLFPALLAVDRARRDGDVRWVIAAALLAAMLVLTRTIGGVVFIASTMAFVYARAWRAAAVYVAVTIVALMPWQLFVWKHAPGFVPELRGSYGPYLEWLVEGYREGGWALAREVASKNIVDVWSSVGTMVSPWVRGGVRGALAAIAIACVFWGALTGLTRATTRIASLALGGYLALVAIWPYQVERFVWGIWPLLLLVAFDGARDVHARVRASGPPRLRLAIAGVAALLIAGNVFYNVRGFSRGWASSASRGMAARLLPVVQYVNNDPRLHGKVISTEASPLVALYSGQQVIPIEILSVRDHIAPKSLPERASIVTAIDRRFRPDAYVLLPAGPYVPALLAAEWDPGRHFLEVSSPESGVRAFILTR